MQRIKIQQTIFFSPAEQQVLIFSATIMVSFKKGKESVFPKDQRFLFQYLQEIKTVAWDQAALRKDFFFHPIISKCFCMLQVYAHTTLTRATCFAGPALESIPAWVLSFYIRWNWYACTHATRPPKDKWNKSWMRLVQAAFLHLNSRRYFCILRKSLITSTS